MSELPFAKSKMLGAKKDAEDKPKKGKWSRTIKSAKGRATAMETKVAEGYKASGFSRARRVPMSGAIVGVLPGDVDPGEEFLCECKMSRSGKLQVQPKWWKQIKQQARDAGRTPVLHGWVAEADDPYDKVVMVPEEVWYALLKERNDLQVELAK